MYVKICVIGAGNGGQALAGYLALKGYDVSLYNRSEKRIAPILKTRKIKLEGEVNATTQISFATTDISEAIKGRKLLIVVVPANAHREVAEKLLHCSKMDRSSCSIPEERRELWSSPTC
jgi:opine dehydrogenase